MNNIFLFACGMAVTLLSGMGVLVYMVHLGYKEKEDAAKREEKSRLMIKEKVDSDLGASTDPAISVPLSNVDSFAGIPSVS